MFLALGHHKGNICAENEAEVGWRAKTCSNFTFMIPWSQKITWNSIFYIVAVSYKFILPVGVVLALLTWIFSLILPIFSFYTHFIFSFCSYFTLSQNITWKQYILNRCHFIPIYITCQCSFSALTWLFSLILHIFSFYTHFSFSFCSNFTLWCIGDKILLQNTIFYIVAASYQFILPVGVVLPL